MACGGSGGGGRGPVACGSTKGRVSGPYKHLHDASPMSGAAGRGQICAMLRRGGLGVPEQGGSTHCRRPLGRLPCRCTPGHRLADRLCSWRPPATSPRSPRTESSLPGRRCRRCCSHWPSGCGGVVTVGYGCAAGSGRGGVWGLGGGAWRRMDAGPRGGSPRCWGAYKCGGSPAFSRPMPAVVLMLRARGLSTSTAPRSGGSPCKWVVCLQASEARREQQQHTRIVHAQQQQHLACTPTAGP